jgi:hypothetical protein
VSVVCVSVCLSVCLSVCMLSNFSISFPIRFKFGVHDPWPMAPLEFVGQHDWSKGSGTLLCNSGQLAAVSKSRYSEAILSCFVG